jgi:hypothetical protein
MWRRCGQPRSVVCLTQLAEGRGGTPDRELHTLLTACMIGHHVIPGPSSILLVCGRQVHWLQDRFAATHAWHASANLAVRQCRRATTQRTHETRRQEEGPRYTFQVLARIPRGFGTAPETWYLKRRMAMSGCHAYVVAILMLAAFARAQQRIENLPSSAVPSSAENSASTANLTVLCLSPPQQGECRGSFVRYFL